MATKKVKQTIVTPIDEKETFVSVAKSVNDADGITMDEKLRTLYQIQLKDTAIDKIHLQRGELPLEVQDMEDEVEGLKTRIANAEADIADIEKKQAELRHAIQEAGLLIEKYSKQQDNVKNNREYESLGKEIEYQSLEQQVCEKRIGECERALAEKRALIDDTKARLAIFEANLEEKKKELEVIIEETAAAEEKFQAEKAELEKKIDERMLVAYNRVRGAAKNHLAVVTIEREACGGCFNQIPPQRKLDIIQGKKIIVCEYCGRILVNPEYKNDYKTEEA
ncbi:MAG: hypothetical protein IIU16_03480 [Bacteroidales bacterium]|jgi:predicted  nucleic acid-binding Zn-ribbon protein|nr:hypothetical protein [Bacteroidales bacterium]MBQ5401958.1 hypothetical protein [Bacteroidales bacterium]MBQ6081487.1 hypothetical protein [Bacteroidales bacterium]MBQ9529681.1 hypothetical protein [Bacteroidales bacterium]